MADWHTGENEKWEMKLQGWAFLTIKSVGLTPNARVSASLPYWRNATTYARYATPRHPSKPSMPRCNGGRAINWSKSPPKPFA